MHIIKVAAISWPAYRRPAPRASWAPEHRSPTRRRRRRPRCGFEPDPAICVAPQYVAEELLRAEGFTDVRYVG